jgi:hypothetical protein
MTRTPKHLPVGLRTATRKTETREVQVRNRKGHFTGETKKVRVAVGEVEFTNGVDAVCEGAHGFNGRKVIKSKSSAIMRTRRKVDAAHDKAIAAAAAASPSFKGSRKAMDIIKA